MRLSAFDRSTDITTVSCLRVLSKCRRKQVRDSLRDAWCAYRGPGMQRGQACANTTPIRPQCADPRKAMTHLADRDGRHTASWLFESDLEPVQQIVLPWQLP